MADDDLILADDPDELGGLDGSVIPKDQRVVPDVIETIRHDKDGRAIPVENVEPFVWAKAHHNLPGFEQRPVRKGARPQGLMIGDEGWIPNDEEGVRAVELGFCVLVDTPPDAPPMPVR